MQAERKAFIEKLQGMGLFGKVDCLDRIGYLWVTPAFSALSFDDKQSFAGVAHAYCFDGSTISETVFVKDDRTGKNIGTFSLMTGLKMK